MVIKSRKIMTIVGSLFAALLMGSNSYAASPGEGFYVGAFFGHGSGVVQAKSTIFNTKAGDTTDPITVESTDGGLGLDGIQGGGWAGFGLKTADDLYFGFEISGAGSDEKIKLTSSKDVAADNQGAVTSASAERNWVAGGALRVGYYVNSETLLAFSGGVAVSQFDVNVAGDKETYYAGGPQVGASITTNITKVDPNLGLRIEFVYTDYLTADINGQDSANANAGNGVASHNNDSELTGSDTAGRIGLTYRF